MKYVSQKELGQRIRAIREKANLTQHDIYEKTKISTTQISAYENGKKNIGLQTIAKIAKALNVTIDFIYYGSPETRPISSATNKGELIVNCISALFDQCVVRPLVHQKENEYVNMGDETYYKIGFEKYVYILDDLVSKLEDFEMNKKNYPDPDSFRGQLLASAAKQINDFDKQ